MRAVCESCLASTGIALAQKFCTDPLNRDMRGRLPLGIAPGCVRLDDGPSGAAAWLLLP